MGSTGRARSRESVIGSRVPRQSLGISVLPGNQEELPRITFPPPADLRIPFGRTVLDTEYADATWQSIRRGDDAARRLGRAIDWLALAWLNLTALSDDIRIPALRAGFEVLLDSDSSDELAERLSQLLRDESPAVERWWVTRAGKPTSAELTDVAWWFTRFSFLRNDLMHGRSTGQPEWLHGDLYQTDLGEWYLREAIKHTVANDGHPAVVENLRWRTVERDARELLKRYREEPPEPGSSRCSPPAGHNDPARPPVNRSRLPIRQPCRPSHRMCDGTPRRGGPDRTIDLLSALSRRLGPSGQGL
jgi:hypothetical protein